MKNDVMQAIDRIEHMEQCFDALRYAVKYELWTDLAKDHILQLKKYYESGEWLKDYELDEKGLLPKDLKRGVLSQDAVYDLLEKIDKFKE